MYTRDEMKYMWGLYKILKSGVKAETKFPALVELQTINRCNARCPMCPYYTTTHKETFVEMSDKEYEKIINQLREKEFGILVLSFQNEPFVDKKLIQRAKLFKEKYPEKRLEVVTNGTLLDDLRSIYEYFDLVSISINAFDKEDYEKTMKGLNWELLNKNLNRISKNKKYREKTVIRYIRQKSNYKAANKFKKEWNKKGFKVFGFEINSRLGAVKDIDKIGIPNNIFRKMKFAFYKKISPFFLANCPIPALTMYIRANGDAVLCFNDWTNENIMGNVLKESIKEVYNNKKYTKAKMNAKQGKLPMDICKKCDLFNEGVWLTV